MNTLKNFDVDVIIPCAGSGEYFREALVSVIKQSYKPKAIYIADNCCGHNRYKDIILEFPNSNIIYIYFEERLNMTENWQRCLKIGESELFAFLHDDDIWLPKYLEEVVSTFNTNSNISIVLTGQQRFNSTPDLLEVNKKDKKLNQIKSLDKTLIKYLLPLLYCSHMSALVFMRRSSISFNLNYKYLPDQQFFGNYIFQENFIIDENVNVLIRLSSSNITSNLMKKSFSITMIEVFEYFRYQTLLYVRYRNMNPKLFFSIEKCDFKGIIKDVKKACFSWPLNKQLIGFGIKLITLEKEKKGGFIKLRTYISSFYWVLFSLLIDFKYYIKTLKED